MATEERFGVRLASPPGLGPEGIREIAAVLSPFTGRPTQELALQLAEGPVVVNSNVTEADARQLVATFRTLGAQADLMEAVLPGEPSPGESTATRPLFAPDLSQGLEGAWRHVITGPRPATEVPKAAHEVDTRKLAAVPLEAISQTQPLRPGIQAATAVQPVVGGAPTARLTMTPATPAAAVFRPGASGARIDPETASFETSPRTELPDAGATQPIQQPTSFEVETRRLSTISARGDAAGETQPVRIPSQSDTLQLSVGDETETRPFRRPVDTLELEAPTATQPMGPGSARAGARHDAETLPRGRVVEPTTDASTGRFGGDDDLPSVANLNDILDTSSIGSVQAGPKVFQLAAPPVGPTETGNLPMPARLDPISQDSLRLRIESTPSGGLGAPSTPFDPTEAPRPGIYRLPAHRQRGGEPSVIATGDPIPLPPAEGTPPPTASPPQPSVRPVSGPANAPRSAASGPAPVASGPRQRASGPNASPLHNPATAAWMSVLVPGLGQVYNGQRERGILFALGAPLILPYLYGIYDAFRMAEEIARGKYSAPDPSARQTAYVGQLALGLAIVFGVVVGAMLWQRARTPIYLPPPTVAASVPPPSTPPTAAAVGAELAAPPSRPRTPLGEGLDVPALMKKGRMACNQGLFSECEEIMHEVIAREPANRDAYNLLVEAAHQRKAAPPSAGRP